MIRAMEFGDRIPLGIFYREEKTNYHSKHKVLAGKEPLVDQKRDTDIVQNLMNEFV